MQMVCLSKYRKQDMPRQYLQCQVITNIYLFIFFIYIYFLLHIKHIGINNNHK